MSGSAAAILTKPAFRKIEWLERDIAIERRPLADAEAAGLVERFDPFEGYERFVRRTIDLDELRAADLSILVEPLYGAGAGWIPRQHIDASYLSAFVVRHPPGM